jgi:NAD(P)H-hydrate epimerase
MRFKTTDGVTVPAVTATQMRKVDSIAVEEFGLTLLQMMENAGRNLAGNVLEMLAGADGPVVVLAGAGGNGGGGLCCARHLHNKDFPVQIILASEPRAMGAAARNQLGILRAAGVHPLDPAHAERALRGAALVVDALIGYGLRQAPRGVTATLIEQCNRYAAHLLALDVPSGLDASTGDAPGSVIHPERTLTLALPKTGLSCVGGDLYLADIGIPPKVYGRLGLTYRSPFLQSDWIHLLAECKD